MDYVHHTDGMTRRVYSIHSAEAYTDELSELRID